ncbi:SapC family protein [Paucibacter sp. DJ1R-11]|uniref:SapC family protein n=1 Tax=Paucibacter sp. DJ1R-11 TaxID=2893556 RepID=UPI0021E49369|nr:SapC family protein [Paucibacter sp. DJ1R-11]MCV2365108.1 SapC family protein [Paucibacter sp. DJ1R-11]
MRPVLLDNVNHADLRLQTRLDASWGDAASAVPTVPAEFRQMQAHFPIVFQESAGGAARFQPVALLGLFESHNQFLGPQGWQAGHLPWALERQPFLVGRDGEEWVVHVDLDSPRLSRSEGEPLFLPQGGQSAVLEHRLSVLQALHLGMLALPEFIDALLQHQLLEPMSLDVEQASGQVRRLAGYFVIDEDRLAALPGTAVAQLHEQGHWLPIAMALASLSHLPELIAREQQRERHA